LASSVVFAVIAVRAPVLAPVFLVALVVLIWCIARTELALLLLVATGPVEGAITISKNPNITVIKVTGALCFLSFILRSLANRQVIHLDRTHVLLLFLLVVSLISSVQARNTDNAFTTAFRYASFAALYVVVTQFPHDRRMLWALVWVLALSSGAAAAMSIRNYFHSSTKLATLPHTNANDMAFILATTLPLVALLLNSRGTWRRFVAASLIGLLFAAIYLSLSRGAWAGLAAGVVWHAVTQKRHIPLLVFGGLVALLAAVLAVQHNSHKVSESFRSKNRVADQNVDLRYGAWRAAATLMTDHPVIGVGPGNFNDYYIEATGRPPGTNNIKVVHDAYLDVGAELGLTGMILFLAFLGVAFRRAVEARRQNRGPPGFASAVETALVIAGVGAVSLSEQYFPPFWILAGLATLLSKEPPASQQQQAAVEAAPV
jgi:O-antigen ligase